VNRRVFLASLFARDTPRNEVAHKANRFFVLAQDWVKEFNQCKGDIYRIQEAATFEAAAKAWREFEKERRKWLKWSV
jgi:hypothetical protein